MSKYSTKPLFLLSVLANLLCLIGAVAVVEMKGGLPWLYNKFTAIVNPVSNEASQDDYFSNRVSIFSQLTIGPDDIVFLGDSIFDFAEWHESLHDQRVKNRAVYGDTTHSILRRLDQITDGKPRCVVLLCGINNFQRRIPLTQTTKEYAEIVARIRSKSRLTEIYLLPVLPVIRMCIEKKSSHVILIWMSQKDMK